MKIFLTVLFFLFLSSSHAHLKPHKTYYKVTYTKGKNWNEKLPFKKQNFIGEHVFYLKNLYKQKIIIFGGSIDKTKMSFIVLKAHSKKEVEKFISKDNAIAQAIISYSIESIKITMPQIKPLDH